MHSMDGSRSAGSRKRVLQEPIVTVKFREKTADQAAPPEVGQNLIFGTGEMADLTRAFDWGRTPSVPSNSGPTRS